MRIELDAPGPDGKPVPHWLSKPAPAVLKLIVRKMGPRQLRLALRDHVKAGSSGPVLYQLYLLGGRAAGEAVIERARVAGFAGLVVTIDTPVSTA